MRVYKLHLLFLRFFLYFKVVLLFDQINVGTVLFGEKDAEKKCWGDEQLALLRARLIYQDVLPKATLIDVKNDEFLSALISYFHLAVNKVKRLTDGPTKRINLQAMSDVLGGYFRSILIPLTKRAFYSGAINYDTTKDVLKFYDSIKLFLHTDGRNWAPPSDSLLNRYARDSAPSKTQNNKIVCGSDAGTCDQLTFTNNNGFIFIPTPYFDSKVSPSAIAVPFRDNPLRNMDHENAVCCLMKYFEIAKKCLEEKQASPDNIVAFNRDFEKFLDLEVFPRLTDEKVYPAFGGVFRIKNEIKRKHVEKRAKTVRNAENDTEEIDGDLQDDDDKAPIIVLVCLCVVTALWLCITLYYCVKNRKTKLPKSSMTDNSEMSEKSQKKRGSSSIQIPEERRHSSATNNSKISLAVAEKPEEKKIAFVEDDISTASKKKKCVVCARNAPQMGPKSCPKCKKRHCRCIKNIWSNFSNYTFTYPRIFPQKKSPTSGKLQKYNSSCPQCKTPKCHHLNDFPEKTRAQTHFLVQMASVIPKTHARTIQSAPVTAGKNTWKSNNTIATNQTEKTETDEKIFVFGYDFETSSSDDSSFTDESSSDTIYK